MGDEGREEYQRNRLGASDSLGTGDDLVGSVLAERYEVLAVVGKGNMGTLYRGRHQSIGREVAVKVLQRKLLANDNQLQRFRSEAKIAGSLSHPNVCAVYDFGELPDGRPYLIMDYINGQSLAWHIKEKGYLTAERAVPLFLQISEGLRHAHSKGLIHRDLKPGNVMIAADNGAETAKLVDFGIAKVVNNEDGDQHLTKTGEIFGSPLYMSPEQCQGFPLDPRSDIYSFGCMMYETLTGKPPLKGDNAVQTIVKHINEEAKPFEQVRPELKVTPALEHVVQRAMKKNPAERYQSTDELHDALKAIQMEYELKHCPNKMPLGRRIALQVVPLVVALGLGGALAYQFASKPAACPINGKPIEASAPATASATGPAIATTTGPAIATTTGPAPDMATGPAPGSLAAAEPAEASLFDPDASTKPELDVLYARIGKGQNHREDEASDSKRWGDINVFITKAHPDVVLMLCGYSHIRWHLRLDSGVKVRQVYLMGINSQEVDGLPLNTKIVSSYDYQLGGEENKKKPFDTYAFMLLRNESIADYDNFKALTATMAKLTGGLKIRNFKFWDQATNIDF